jgi:membrane-associated phospholipid phosphatase
MKLSKIISLIPMVVLLVAIPRLSLASIEDEKSYTTRKSTSKSEEGATEEQKFYRENQSPYRVNLALDLGIVVVGSLIASVPRLMVNEGEGPWCGLECDLDDVNDFDRQTMAEGSELAGDFSDYVMYGLVSFSLIFDIIDVGVSDPHDGWRGFGVDFLVVLETAMVTLGVNGLVAMIVRRPRPYVYDDTYSEEFRTEGEAATSFYSGHTSLAFSVATSYSRLFMLRHPDSPLIAPIWIFSYAAAGTVGALRLVSSSHFLSDVLVGAVAGVGFGLLVPWLHELPRKKSSSPYTQQARFRMSPYFSGISAGVFGSFN